MKGSKRAFTESPIEVPPCRFATESYDMENVDDRWMKRLRVVKLDDNIFVDE